MTRPRTRAVNPLLDARRRLRPGLAVVVGFSLVVNLLMLTVPLYMMQVYDRVLTSGSRDTLVYLTLIAAGALLLYGTLEGVRGAVMNRLASWMEGRLGAPALARLVDSRLSGAGGASAEALRDLGTIRGFLTGGLLAFIDLPWVPVYLAAIWLLHPVLGQVALAGALLLILLTLIGDRLTRPLAERAQREQLAGQQRGEDVLRNAELVDALGMLPQLARSWQGRMAGALALQASAGGRAAVVLGFTRMLRLGVQVAVLAAGAALVLSHEITGGAMIAASIVLGRALAPVEQVLSGWRGTAAARTAWRRLWELFDRPVRRPDAMPLPAPAGRLSVEKATVTVPRSDGSGQGRVILRDVTFQLDPGDGLALIGPSGSGKSTLARLLVGVLRPRSGVVRLDGADVAQWPSGALGRHIGYLPQEVRLFPGTLAENIARFDPAAAPEAIVEAATLAGVHELILRQPGGYDTPVQGDGEPLSGGQRQRVALARALFGRPSLVVLDEPNGNLDTEGEAALNEAIRSLRERGATVVVISHRASALRHIDTVLLLAGGAVERFGPRDVVLTALKRQTIRPVETTGAEVRA